MLRALQNILLWEKMFAIYSQYLSSLLKYFTKINVRAMKCSLVPHTLSVKFSLFCLRL